MEANVETKQQAVAGNAAKTKSKKKTIIIVCVIVAVLLLVCCCGGCILFAIFGSGNSDNKPKGVAEDLIEQGYAPEIKKELYSEVNGGDKLFGMSPQYYRVYYEDENGTNTQLIVTMDSGVDDKCRISVITYPAGTPNDGWKVDPDAITSNYSYYGTRSGNTWTYKVDIVE